MKLYIPILLICSVLACPACQRPSSRALDTDKNYRSDAGPIASTPPPVWQNESAGTSPAHRDGSKQETGAAH